MIVRASDWLLVALVALLAVVVLTYAALGPKGHRPGIVCVEQVRTRCTTNP